MSKDPEQAMSPVRFAKGEGVIPRLFFLRTPVKYEPPRMTEGEAGL